MASVTRPEGSVMDLGRYDALVIGGGLSGWSAAVTLARAGREVLILAERTALGHEIWAALSVWPGDQGGLGPSALVAEMLDGLSAASAVRDGAVDPVATEILLDRLADEAGVKVLLQVRCHPGEGDQAIMTGKWGTMAASASVFVDGTPAGSFALEAGAACVARPTDEPLLRRMLFIKAECEDDAELEVGGDLPVAGGAVRARKGVWPGDVIVEACLSLDAADPDRLEVESRRVMAEAAARIRSRAPGFATASLVHVAYDLILPRAQVIQGADAPETVVELATGHGNLSVPEGSFRPAGLEALVLASPAADLGDITALECYQARNAVRVGEAAAAVAGRLLEA